MARNLSTQKDALVARDFRNFVQEISHNKITPDEEFMLGKNPFQAFREDAGYTLQEMAHMLDMASGAYLLIEAGESKPDIDDYIRFCSILENVHPADLMDTTKPLSRIELEVLMLLYQEPEALKSKYDTAYIQSHAKDVLVEQADYDAVICVLIEKQHTLKATSPKRHYYADLFIDMLLTSDTMRPIADSGFFEKEVRTNLQTDLETKRKRLNYYQENFNMHERAFNRDIGLRFFGEDRSEVVKKIMDVFCANAEYYDLTESIQWFNKYAAIQETIKDNAKTNHTQLFGQTMRWDEARTVLIDSLELLQLSKIEINSANNKMITSKGQEIVFDVWCEDNADLIRRYENRQFILAHIDLPECHPEKQMAHTFPQKQKDLARKLGL